MLESGDIAREKGPKRIGPYGVTKSMSSSCLLYTSDAADD